MKNYINRLVETKEKFSQNRCDSFTYLKELSIIKHEIEENITLTQEGKIHLQNIIENDANKAIKIIRKDIKSKFEEYKSNKDNDMLEKLIDIDNKIFELDFDEEFKNEIGRYIQDCISALALGETIPDEPYKKPINEGFRSY